MKLLPLLLCLLPLSLAFAGPPGKNPFVNEKDPKPDSLEFKMPDTSSCEEEQWEDDLSEAELATHKKSELECKEAMIAKAMAKVEAARRELAEWRKRQKAGKGKQNTKTRSKSIAVAEPEYKPLKGFQLGLTIEGTTKPIPGLSKTHVFFELGYMKHGSLMFTLAPLVFTAYEARSKDTTFTGARFSAGYVFSNGLFAAAGFAVNDPRELSETYRVGYLDKSGFNVSIFLSGFRYGERIHTLHFGFGVGAAI